jgi:hypothetical protein
MVPKGPSFSTAFWALLALLAYLGMAGAAPWSEHFGVFLALFALAFVACWGAARSSMGFWPLVIGAFLFRALLVPLEPELSDDIFRYVWEGRVQLAGFDPYTLPPMAPELADLRDALWSRINHPEATAIYPPLAQLLFRGLAAGGDVTFFKAAFVLGDLGVVLILARAMRAAGQPLPRIAYYAWNPLPIVEVAGSGHLEPLALLPFVLAIVAGTRRKPWSWCALGASVAVKYSGAWVAPFLFRARRPTPLVVALTLLGLVLVSLPYMDAGGKMFDSLQLYAAKWRFNDLLFLPLATLLGSLGAAKLAAALSILFSVAWLLWRNVPLPRAALITTATILLLSPTIHPWYLLWFVVLLPLSPSLPLFLWSGCVVFAYLFLFSAFGLEPFPSSHLLPRLLQMIPVLLGLVWLHRRNEKGSDSRSPSPNDDG